MYNDQGCGELREWAKYSLRRRDDGGNRQDYDSDSSSTSRKRRRYGEENRNKSHHCPQIKAPASVTRSLNKGEETYLVLKDSNVLCRPPEQEGEEEGEEQDVAQQLIDIRQVGRGGGGGGGGGGGPKASGTAKANDRGYSSLAAAELLLEDQQADQDDQDDNHFGLPLPADEVIYTAGDRPPNSHSTAEPPQQSQPPQQQQSFKKSSRRQRPKPLVDWGNLLLLQPAPEEQQQARQSANRPIVESQKSDSKEESLSSSVSAPLPRVVKEELKKVRKWDIAGEDEAEEEAEIKSLYEALHQSQKLVSELQRKMEIMPSVRLTGTASGLAGTEMDEEGDTALSITATSEFAKSVMTPLEKLEEKRSVALERRRVLGGENESQRKKGARTAAVTFADRSEDSLAGVSEQAAVAPADEEKEQFVANAFNPSTMDMGMASALRYIKEKGDLSETTASGRVGRGNKTPLYKGVGDDDVKIDYTDDYGNVMTPKEAFRYMSWHFHGKTPGKAKMEKRLRRMELEHQLKSGDPYETLPTLRALKSQHRKGQSYLVLTTSNSQSQSAPPVTRESTRDAN